MQNLYNLAIFLLLFLNLNFISAEQFISNLSILDKQTENFQAPSKRQLELESETTVKLYLSWNGGSTKHWYWWKKIIEQEERGVFGYHAAKQQYRVFQDIIKMIFIEILEFEIKKDFHFFRIPFDNDLFESKSAADYLKVRPNPEDSTSPDRDQILSMNYTLFGNYASGSQCSASYFSQNLSWFNIHYSTKLEALFKELGIPKSEIPDLLKAGHQFVGFETGVLYQFTDTSHHNPNYHNAYELVDLMAYPAVSAGGYDHNVRINLSKLFLDDKPTKFDKYSGQLRLIMNTAETLNPYSSICIRRYDQVDPQIIQHYEKSLREKIRKLPTSKTKIENYKKKLKAYWYVQD